MNTQPIRVGIIGAAPDRGWSAAAHIPALKALPQYALGRRLHPPPGKRRGHRTQIRHPRMHSATPMPWPNAMTSIW